MIREIGKGDWDWEIRGSWKFKMMHDIYIKSINNKIKE